MFDEILDYEFADESDLIEYINELGGAVLKDIYNEMQEYLESELKGSGAK